MPPHGDSPRRRPRRCRGAWTSVRSHFRSSGGTSAAADRRTKPLRVDSARNHAHTRLRYAERPRQVRFVGLRNRDHCSRCQRALAKIRRRFAMNVVTVRGECERKLAPRRQLARLRRGVCGEMCVSWRSEEHTSELQSQSNLVCRLLLEKKKKKEQTKRHKRPSQRIP